jgi:hypothetical protein
VLDLVGRLGEDVLVGDLVEMGDVERAIVRQVEVRLLARVNLPLQAEDLLRVGERLLAVR